MIKVSVTQHLIHTEEEFVQELSKTEFSVPNEYSFQIFMTSLTPRMEAY